MKRHGLSKEEGGVAVAQVRWRLQHAVGDVDGSELSVSADAKRIAAHSVGTESGGNLSLSHPRESVDTGTGRSDVVGVNREDLGESGGGGGGRRGVEGEVNGVGGEGEQTRGDGQEVGTRCADGQVVKGGDWIDGVAKAAEDGEGGEEHVCVGDEEESVEGNAPSVGGFHRIDVVPAVVDGGGGRHVVVHQLLCLEVRWSRHAVQRADNGTLRREGRDALQRE